MASLDRPLDVRRLPTNSEVRSAQLAEHARPTILRPLLPEDQEEKLASVEAKTARCYTGMEELTYNWQKLADKLRAGRIRIRAAVAK